MWKVGLICLEIVLILMQDWVHGLHGTYHMLRNPFGRTLIELLDEMCHMESRFGLFEKELVLAQDGTQFAPNAS